jgi:hypothetical protein
MEDTGAVGVWIGMEGRFALMNYALNGDDEEQAHAAGQLTLCG